MVARAVIVGGAFWDFVDRRQIDVHITCQLIIWSFIYAGYRLTEWGYAFAEKWLDLAATKNANVSGTELGMVLGAINAPMGLVLAAVLAKTVDFYLRARRDP